MNEITEFYKGMAVHPDGYTPESIIKSDDYFLEVTHDYIQWLFPLKKASEAVPESPILNIQEIQLFRNDPKLMQTLMHSFRRILKFYGFEIIENNGTPVIQRASNFDKRCKNWLTHRNHNYKRISRILESLCLLGLHNVANVFFSALKDVYQEQSSLIGQTTFNYWKESVSNDV